MSDLLSISSTAVMAYQRALGTVSNNIANVGTEGYSRQDVTLNTNVPTKNGSVYIGNGVVFEGVKRQVDDFIESNLRNSQSELSTQEPMLNYANRVVDILGSESTGLTTALNQFFSSAQALSVDPASPIGRASFLSDASSLTSRFRELSGQLESLQDETAQAVQAKVGQLNTLAQQLALVNKQLSKNLTVAKQPPELLDQRDLVLKKMSVFAAIKTSFATTGAVSVSLGPTMTQGLLVDNQQFTSLVASPGADSTDSLNLGLRKTDGSIEGLSNVSSGEIGGLMAFRLQVLEPARSALDVFSETFVDEINAVHVESLDGYGDPGQALFEFDAVAGSSYTTGGMQVAVDDPRKIAAAAQFRVIAAPNNPSKLFATLIYQEQGLPVLPDDLTAVLDNNPSISAATAFSISSTQPFALVTGVAQGTENPVVYLGDLDDGQSVQLMTREGVHVLGSELSLDEQNMMLRDTYGFNSAAAYNTDYLNVEGDLAYRKAEMFLGAKAAPAVQQVFDDAGEPMEGVSLDAVLTTGRISSSLQAIPDGVITLNGTSMGALAPTGPNTEIQAGEIAAWLESAGITGLEASASNEIRVAASDLDLTLGFSLEGYGGASADIAGSFDDLSALVAAVNLQSVTTAVAASVSRDGELVLTNTVDNEGNHITIGNIGSYTENTLGLTAQTFAGSVSVTRTQDDPLDLDIRVGMGADGAATDLQALGLRTAVYFGSQSVDDFVVLVTGAGDMSASAGYTAASADRTQALRVQPFDITFSAEDQYTITDRDTNTVIATRRFDPDITPSQIMYRGVTLTFTSPPTIGDSFGVDGNHDGVGNNEGMLNIVALGSAKVMPGGKTFAEAYIEQVSQVGNMAQQALVAKDALTVVFDQAVEARDGISGVSLDEEAASLIRFQQAYQASAKVMQTASTLFDAILAVR
jgi:flagellar hook-associated protein 1